ncbi:MAG: DoxX family protein [Bacteroidia bacterium]|nr:DoxX family protein [Bacteroidia bacterium]
MSSNSAQKGKIYLERILAWITTLILLQTLYFKFSGAEESVWIFTQMGIEPWGRFFTGGVELVAGILLLIPRTAIYGAGLSLGTIAGALFSHLFVLGIVVKDDGGFLFILAAVVFVLSALILFLRMNEIKALLNKILKKG